jgi:hypothetical protein
VIQAPGFDLSFDVDRRRALAWAGSAAALTFAGPAMAATTNPMSGDALFADVRAYDALGEHRTASPGDVATSHWLSTRMREAGLTVSPQAFAAPLFEPEHCRIAFAGGEIAAFPAWPVVPTDGLDAAIAPADAGDLTGKIALVGVPPGAGASWAARHAGETVMAAIGRGAVGVIAVTEGPTGEIIALNTEPGRFQFAVPVLIAAGRDGPALAAAAVSGARVRLVSTGRSMPGAEATNVIGRRPGTGKAIVVTTPKSGWFHCAGERGSGIAVFLALADQLARHTDAHLVFAATAAHEHGYGGGVEFVKLAPATDDVRVWLHIGANVAVQTENLATGRGAGQAVTTRGVAASPDVFAPAHAAFAGIPGYETPRALTAKNAAGELQVFHDAGYPHLAGLLGAYAYFHTPLDRADVATTPAILAPVAKGARDLLMAFA